MSENDVIEASINGNAHRLSAVARIPDALEAVGIDREMRGVAVALNGEVVPRSRWQEVTIPAAACIEIVTATQGG